MNDTSKAITSESGGLRGPAQGIPSSIALPKGKIPAVVSYPSTGIVVAPPFMAKAITDGKKNLLVLPREVDIAPGQYVLLSQRKALAVVEIGKHEVFTTETELLAREGDHLIGKVLKDEWGEVQVSWAYGPWHAWAIKSLEVFSEPKGTNVIAGVSTLVRDVEITTESEAEKASIRITDRTKELIEKIKDVKNYSADKMTDAQLRDDFRILLAWFSAQQKNPEGFEYDLWTIEDLLKKVLKELMKRGPEAIRFNPNGMKPNVKKFFLRVAGQVGVPETMMKRLNLSSDTDPESLSLQELLAAHWQLHGLYSDKKFDRGAKGWSTEDIVNLHAKVVDMLFLKGKDHPAPPDNGLDDLSEDFEDSIDEQRVDWTKEPSKSVTKSEFSIINRSGVKRGSVIKVADVLQHFKDFKMRKPYIYLVGGLANHGETDGDIDVLVNDDEETPVWMQDVIAFRLGRALPTELSKRLHVHFDRDRGPFTNFVELYDLRAERVNPDNEVKEMGLSDDDESGNFSDLREYVYQQEVEKNWEPDDEEVKK
jgi:hypothetical protein